MGAATRAGGVVCAVLVGALGGCGPGARVGADADRTPPSPSALRATGAKGAQLDTYAAANASGEASTLRTGGGPVLDPGNGFFQPLGTNGRSCATCHVPQENFSITPAGLQARFDATEGRDPIFTPNDGTDSPLADRSTLAARRTASSLLLSRGTLRIQLGVPPTADFELISVDDPYGFATAQGLSLFRRPLASTNLDIVTVMLDGRETLPGRSLHDDLVSQARDAILGHEQAAQPPSPQQLDAIVDYESHLFTAQTFGRTAGTLVAEGATGGPWALSAQSYYPGINDLFGDARSGAAFDPEVMTMFRAWDGLDGGGLNAGRAAIARGEALFNTRTLHITGVAGINDNPAFGSPAELDGTCSTCHDAPNVGNHSVGLPLDLGIADVHPVGGLDVAGLPVYTFRSKVTGAVRAVTDPGVALISGRFADLGKFKGPTLRGIAGHPPYFHNGSAHALGDVVRFYDARFQIGLTAQEQSDLVAFLSSL